MRFIKVTVRKKPISKGRHSVYLDFWPPIPHPETGQATRREFLGLYIFDNPRSSDDQQHNQDMLNIAQTLRNKRVYELNKSELHADLEPEKVKTSEVVSQDFLIYFRSLAEKREIKDRGVWISTLRYLKKWAGGPIMFAELDIGKINAFKEYLESRYLAQNTKASYFMRVKTALKEAFREGILEKDLNTEISVIKEQKTPRVYLTLEELNKLAKTPCTDDQLRRACLFSALTGLNLKKIRSMTWKEVRQKRDQYFLRFRQTMIGQTERHPISKQAYDLLGPAGEPREPVFHDLNKSVYNNTTLSDWLKAAEIIKNMSFQGFRHTYAVNQLLLGTDVYTVSRMLGHQDIKSTLVYARLADELKSKAADRIMLQM